MQIIENNLIKEKVYIEKFENGMTLMCIPKKNALKKYVIIGVNYGSNDFMFDINGKTHEVPQGIAHYLEHKMFEQENGKNSLDVLTSLGANANAYTTNDHTAYLFECTDKFDESLDELLNYVQNPYFTDENVEKERGIISQEIQMYKDEPFSEIYMNAMRAMYKNCPVRIDVAGTVESIQDITKENLYECYNNFYTPDNMVIVVSGDFIPEEIFEKIKTKLTRKNGKDIVKKIKKEEPKQINQKRIEKSMEISTPLFLIGYKDNNFDRTNIKRKIAIEILLELICGNSSKLYNDLYNKGNIYSELSTSYEYTSNYGHALIECQTSNLEETISKIQEEIKNTVEKGINKDDFERIKHKIYGLFVREFDSVSNVAGTFLVENFRGTNPFEYLEGFLSISKEYTESISKEIFDDNYMVISIITPKK